LIVEKKMISKRFLEDYCAKYGLGTDLELLRQEFRTLETRVVSAELEVAELYDKAYAALKRLEMRQRRETPPEGPVAVSGDPITEKILARRATRAVHAKQG
jgi:hypothetical protein